MILIKNKNVRIMPFVNTSIFCCCFFMVVSIGGIHAQWETVFGPLPFGSDHSINGISFANDSIGYAIGSYEFDGKTNYMVNYIMKTEDYANSWDTIFTYTHEPIPFAEFQDVYFIDESTGWVCGTYLGFVLKTTDGGMTWNSYPIPEEAELLYKIKFADQNYGVCLNESTGSSPIQTFDGGTTWYTTDAVSGYDVSFIDSCNFIAVRANGLHIHETCAISFHPFPTNDEVVSRSGRAIQMQGNNNWVLGSIGLMGLTNFASILNTDDGGQSYVINDLFFANWVSCFGFIDDQTGYVSVAGSDNYPCAVLKTTNGGTIWHCQETPEGIYMGTPFRNSFSKIECPTDNFQYGVNGRMICRTTNGGGPLGDTYTGIKVISNKTKTLSLYPNPSSSVVRIEVSDAQDVREVSVYNSTGQLILHANSSPQELHVAQWASGCYTVVVRYDNEVVRSRFVVE